MSKKPISTGILGVAGICFTSLLISGNLMAQTPTKHSVDSRNSVVGNPRAHDRKTPPSCPSRTFEHPIHFDASLIYWLAKQEGNEYATTGNAITVPGTTDPNTGLVPGPVQSGHVFAPDPQLKPGFKVGVGVEVCPRDWDVFTEYTYLFNKADGSVSSDVLNTGILPLISFTPHNSIFRNTTFFASTGATGFVSSANSYWSLHFNTIKLVLRKMMQLYPNLSLRPHVGLQGSWQQQKFTAHYTVKSTSDLTTVLGVNKVISDQDFWGVGLRGGIDGVWRWIEHLGLYANSAVATLWGNFQNRGRSFDTNFAAGYSNVLIGDTLNDFNTITPILELELGLQTDWDLYNKYTFLIQAGWEQQFWFFLNGRSTSIANTSLVLQGLSFRFRFDF